MSTPGALSAACLALLSVWRWQDGDHLWAAVLGGAALLQVLLVLFRTRPTTPGSGRVADPGTGQAAPTQITAEHARRHRPGWIAIAVFGLVMTAVMLPLLPMASLVLAATSAYAAWQARTYGRVLAAAKADR